MGIAADETRDGLTLDEDSHDTIQNEKADQEVTQPEETQELSKEAEGTPHIIIWPPQYRTDFVLGSDQANIGSPLSNDSNSQIQPEKAGPETAQNEETQANGAAEEHVNGIRESESEVGDHVSPAIGIVESEVQGTGRDTVVGCITGDFGEFLRLFPTEAEPTMGNRHNEC